MAVSLDFYKTFYYAAKYGSFTEAAKALYVTQPTVTHAISCLERYASFALPTTITPTADKAATHKTSLNL